MKNTFAYNSHRTSASGLSIKELSAAIGKIAELSAEKFTVDVEIMDVKQAFGRTDYLVKPVAGRGEVWVSAERISLK